MKAEKLKELVAFDSAQKAGGYSWIAGVDEAGRGPLAGPVVAAAVILHEAAGLEGLDDSKRIPERRREKLFELILRKAWIGIGMVATGDVDRINVYQASRRAMTQALYQLPVKPGLVLIDGRIRLDFDADQMPLIKGDGRSASIAAASIVAKVYRDAWMKRLDHVYPGYDFCAHKGYGTQRHLEAVGLLGPTPEHRRSFSPIRSLVEETA